MHLSRVSQSTPKGAVVYTHSFFRDEVAFLAALRAGHRSARGVLFQRYSPVVEQVILGVLGSSHTGSSHTGSSRTGSSHTGSSHTGSSHTGSSHTGSSHTGSRTGFWVGAGAGGERLEAEGPARDEHSELVQRVFLQALQQLPRFRASHTALREWETPPRDDLPREPSQRDPLEEWLLQITVQVLVRHLRVTSWLRRLSGAGLRKRFRGHLLRSGERLAAQDLGATHQLLRALPALWQVVFYLTDVAGWGARQVAACCGMSRIRVKRLRQRAQVRLERLLRTEPSSGPACLGETRVERFSRRLAQASEELRELRLEHDLEAGRVDECERFLGRAEQHWGQRHRRAALVSAAAAALLLLCGLLFYSTQRPAQLTVDVAGVGDDPSWLAADSNAVMTTFSDGSRLDLSPGGRVRLHLDDPLTPAVSLETGFAKLELASSESRQWSLFAGPFAIQGSGAGLDVYWLSAEQQLEIEVHSGRVRVQGPVIGGARVVVADQSLRVSVPFARAVLTSGGGQPSTTSYTRASDPQSLDLDDVLARDLLELDDPVAAPTPGD